MGRNLHLGCPCGAAHVKLPRGFESEVLHDRLESLARVRVPLPPLPRGPTGADVQIPAERLASWIGSAWGRLRARRESLPELLEIGLERPGSASEWALFTADGQGHRVSSEDPRELSVVALAPAVLQAIAATHRLPIADAQGRWPPPSPVAARHERGATCMPPALFEAIFAGSPYRLRRGTVLDRHAWSFAELRALGRHAARCGRPITAYFL